MNTEKIFTLAPHNLKKALRHELIHLGYNERCVHNKKDFLYAEGDAPYMLVAHLDTVHQQLPSIICYSKDGNYMMSPQGIGGDDRCGVYIILSLLNKLSFKPYIVFTMDEEIGGLGATAFVNYMKDYDVPELKYIVEYDRKGDNDCVFYRCDNKDFVDFVEQFGFKKSFGTFSDISIIAPNFNVAAVNLSSGYYNPHTNYEYVSFGAMSNVIEQSIKMLETECEAFEYIEEKIEIQKYNRSAYDIEVFATPIPQGTVWVYDWMLEDYRGNYEDELVIDEFGVVYKYTPYCEDYIRTGNLKYVDDDETLLATYDANNVIPVQIYNYKTNV